MIRICTSLANSGYTIVLIGRKVKTSVDLIQQPFIQKRIPCFFDKGIFFYAEYNIRLCFYLLFSRMDCIGAIDLDTILPCYLVSLVKRTKRVYDAHELFCEMKEITERPHIYKLWKCIERFTVPKFRIGYTVNQPIADEFFKMYGVQYEVIRNIAVFRKFEPVSKNEKFILYQGAVNEGRCFETLIPAMKGVNCKLVICGDGNFLQQAKLLTKKNKLEDKIIFKGKITPGDLLDITRKAYLGITLFDDRGLSNYYSLANRFFDYIHARIPQVCVDFPVYREINDQVKVAVLVKDTGTGNLTHILNNLLDNEVLYKELQLNCTRAGELYNWQGEEKKLIDFYSKIEKALMALTS